MHDSLWNEWQAVQYDNKTQCGAQTGGDTKIITRAKENVSDRQMRCLSGKHTTSNQMTTKVPTTYQYNDNDIDKNNSSEGGKQVAKRSGNND